MSGQYFVIGTDGRHHGPLSPDDVRTWLTDGRASRYSRARRDGEDQWTALREMPEFEEATRPPHLGGAPAGVDATEREEEGAPGFAPHRVARARLDPLSCFRRAWWLLTRDFAVLAGSTLLVAMAIVAISIIPRVGWLISLLINNLLTAGLYLVFLTRMRGQQLALGDLATSVRDSAARLVLAGMAQSLITAPIVFAGTTTSDPVRGALLLVSIPCLYLLVGYVFVLPLIVDQDMSFWGAMERSRRTVQRQWLQTFGLLFAAGLLLIVPVRWFVFGLVITLPLCTAALMFAYEDMFNTGDA